MASENLPDRQPPATPPYQSLLGFVKEADMQAQGSEKRIGALARAIKAINSDELSTVDRTAINTLCAEIALVSCELMDRINSAAERLG